MRARLGFSIATSIDPDILLLDEVLGTGDQTFRARSQARVRELVDKAPGDRPRDPRPDLGLGVLQPGDPPRAGQADRRGRSRGDRRAVPRPRRPQKLLAENDAAALRSGPGGRPAPLNRREARLCVGRAPLRVGRHASESDRAVSRLPEVAAIPGRLTRRSHAATERPHPTSMPSAPRARRASSCPAAGSDFLRWSRARRTGGCRRSGTSDSRADGGSPRLLALGPAGRDLADDPGA